MYIYIYIYMYTYVFYVSCGQRAHAPFQPGASLARSEMRRSAVLDVVAARCTSLCAAFRRGDAVMLRHLADDTV